MRVAVSRGAARRRCACEDVNKECGGGGRACSVRGGGVHGLDDRPPSIPHPRAGTTATRRLLQRMVPREQPNERRQLHSLSPHGRRSRWRAKQARHEHGDVAAPSGRNKVTKTQKRGWGGTEASRTLNFLFSHQHSSKGRRSGRHRGQHTGRPRCRARDLAHTATQR